MNENPFKKIDPPKAMEGRFVDKDGKDHGDRDFHERQMGMDEAQELADLEALKKAK
jgi:hypothetical protein